MRLWEKAKRLGIRDPSAVDLSQDRRDWEGPGAEEQVFLPRLNSTFLAGEEAVTRDFLPLLEITAAGGRIE